MERISPDEIAYHVLVVARATEAQMVLRSWGEHLAMKYQLAPGEQIDADGVIHRAPKPEAAS